MYFKKEIVKNIGGISFDKDDVFLHADVGEKKTQLHICSSGLQAKWVSPEEGIYTLFFNDEIIAYGSRIQKTLVVREKRGLELINSLGGVFSSIGDSLKSKSIFIGNSKPHGFIRLNLKTGQIEKVYSENNPNGLLVQFSDFVIRYNYSKGMVSVNDYDLNTIWEHDLSELGSYTDMLGRFYKGEVKNVYLFENKVIVLAGAAIVAYDLNTGEKLWQHTKTPTYWDMALNGNLGYLSTNAAWGILNLESGELENKGKFPDIRHKGKNFWATGGELTWYDGLLWLNVFSSGYAFIVAMNPQTGNYEWVEEVETTEAINPPKFHGNRMYLLDTGRTLHVYEKE